MATWNDDGGSNKPSHHKGGSRPTSARGKTTKEIELEKALKVVRGRVTDRDKTIKVLEADKKQLQRKIDQLEAIQKKVQKKMDKEQKIRTGAVSEKQQMKEILQKTQRAIAARMKLLGIDFSKCQNIKEALDAALSAINKLISQLEEKEALLKKMEEENAFLKNKVSEYESKIEKLKKKLNAQSNTIEEQTKTIEVQNKKILKLEDENAQYKEENEKLKNELQEMKDKYKNNKDDYSKKFEEMAAKILALQSENVEKTAKIGDLSKLVEELQAKVQSQSETIAEQDNELSNLRKELSRKDNKISSLETQIEVLKERIKELEDELNGYKNRPVAHKLVQTEITGDIGAQLSDYPRLLKEIVALKNLLGQKNEWIAKLEEENRELLEEMEDLLKKVVRFYPCSTNHKLPVTCMESSPSRYVVATGSIDMTVRLWVINPDMKKASEKVRVYQRSMIEGKVDCLTWNYDGSLLAAGTGYKNTPDGFVLVWSMRGDNKYSSIYAIRSRPTVRFGRVKSISFSKLNNQFLYCGDTTGSIWVFDLMKELERAGSGLISVIKSQTDVVNDLRVTNDGRFLFSVSHDQSLAVIELTKEIGGSKDSNDNNNSNNNKSGQSATPTGTKSGSKAISLATQTSTHYRKASRDNRKNSKRNLRLTQSSSNKSNKHGRTRSKSRSKGGNNTKSGNIQYSLQELLADDNMPKLLHYRGTVIAQDGQYPIWKVDISPSGKTVVCASRKVRVYSVSGDGMDNVEKGPNIGDKDLDHVRSLKLRNNNLLICRTSVPRAKLFDSRSGKEIKTFKTKDPCQAVEFLPDDMYIIIATQVTTEKSSEPPKFKLAKYSDTRKPIEKETDVTWVGSGHTNDDDEKGDA